MASKSSKGSSKAGTVAAVAIAGAVAWKIGSEIYKAWNSSSSSQPAAEESEKKAVKSQQREESKEETKEFQLDPGMDIDSLTCPITCQVISEPASTVYGHLYELSAIREWVERKGTCPLTHQPLTFDQIQPQFGLKSTIEQMKAMKRQNEAQKQRIVELEALAAQAKLSAAAQPNEHQM